MQLELSMQSKFIRLRHLFFVQIYDLFLKAKDRKTASLQLYACKLLEKKQYLGYRLV